MRTHLPPSFACSKCPKNFVRATNFKEHLKIHAGILDQFCKICNKAYSSKKALSSHIMYNHFSKLHCEIINCSYKCGGIYGLKKHLKAAHKHSNQNMIEKLLEGLEKLKPDFQKMTYVNKFS